MDREIVSVLFDDKQLDAGLVAGADHAIRVIHGQRHRFFNDEVFAIRRQFDAMTRVVSAFRQDADNVDAASDFTHHIVHVDKPGDAATFSYRARKLRNDITGSHQLSAFHLVFRKNCDMLLRDAAATKQRKT